MANVIDCGIIVSQFEIQSCYYDHFQTNALWKDTNFLILQLWVYIIPLLFFYKDGFGILWSMKIDISLNNGFVKCVWKKQQQQKRMNKKNKQTQKQIKSTPPKKTQQNKQKKLNRKQNKTKQYPTPKKQKQKQTNKQQTKQNP